MQLYGIGDLHLSLGVPEKPMDTNVIHAFMGRVKTEEARQATSLGA